MFTNCSLKEKRKLDKVIFTNLQFQRKSKPFAHNQAKILNVLAKQTLMSFKHLSLSFHECLKRLMEGKRNLLLISLTVGQTLTSPSDLKLRSSSFYQVLVISANIYLHSPATLLGPPCWYWVGPSLQNSSGIDSTSHQG